MSRQAIRRTVAILAALACACGAAGGCIIIVPTVPHNVDGYGQSYAMVDAGGSPLDVSGLLVMVTGVSDLVRCFPIESGHARAPKTLAICAESIKIFPAEDLPFTYWRKLYTPSGTGVYALIPGHVPADWLGHTAGEDSNKGGPLDEDALLGIGIYRMKPPGGVSLVAAAPAVERRYLERLARVLGWREHDATLRKNKQNTAAIMQAMGWVRDRLKALGADVPAPP